MHRWTVHLKGGRSNRYHAVVPVEQEVYAFGGYGLSKKSHILVYRFNTVALRWTKLAPVITGGERSLEVPSMRCGYTAVLIGKRIYIWGGYPYYIDLYAFDVRSHRWFKVTVSGAVPDAASDHSACVLGKAMYIHGGITELDDTCNNHTYKLDTTTMFWTLIDIRGTPPPTSIHHSATIIGTKMFVFQGFEDLDYFNMNNIRVFDTESNFWLSKPSEKCPEVILPHSAFAYNGELYICRAHKYVNDDDDDVLWKFNPEKFWRKLDNGSFLRLMHWTHSCMVGDRIIVFGGCYSFVPEGYLQNNAYNRYNRFMMSVCGMLNCYHHLYILDLCPSLKTICKLAVTKYSLDQSELPHNIRWELAAMITYRNRKTMSVLAASGPPAKKGN